MCGWAFILFEIFLGPASSEGKSLSPAVSYSFNLMRLIVSIGWSIYPLGYYFGYLLGQISDAPLNLIYNLADFINKIYFCAAIWSAARTETLARESKVGPDEQAEAHLDAQAGGGDQGGVRRLLQGPLQRLGGAPRRQALLGRGPARVHLDPLRAEARAL